MPSVSTQTTWSWMEDARELERLARSYDKERDHFSSRLDTCVSDSAAVVLPSITVEQGPKDEKRQRSVTFASLPPLSNYKECEEKEEGEKEEENQEHEHEQKEGEALRDAADLSAGENDSLQTNGEESNTGCTKNGMEHVDRANVTLPLIPVTKEQHYRFSLLSDESAEEVTVSSSRNHDALIFDKLEQENYSEQETSEESDSETSSDDTNKNEDSDNEPLPEAPSFLYDLESASKLSWPTILHYVMESESKHTQYFSLDNKGAVERRLEDVKTVMPSSRDGEAPEETDKGNQLAVKNERDGSSFCHFCGRRLPNRSLLADMQDIEKIKEQDYICCKEYKEHTILVAVCMRRMVEKMRTDPPQKQGTRSKDNAKEKKQLMEEKALAILRKKQRWEEIRRRRADRAQERKQLRHTKTIKFTLESTDDGWAVKNRHTKSQDQQESEEIGRRQKRKKKLTTEERAEVFSADILERLQAQFIPRQLEMRFFSAEKTSLTILPDGTGYCNYPSGHKAVVMFTLYTGALAYMVFEDSSHPKLLACADELGRSCCYFPSGKMRFLCTPQLMLHFDASSQTRRKLKSSDGILFQPVSIPLNKYVTFKCNQDNTSLILSFPHDHMKFTISSKLQKGEEPGYRHQLQSSMESTEANLAATKSRISKLLHLLQNVSQVQKLSKLEALYGTPQARNPPLNPPTAAASRNEGRASARKRTKSLGALKPKTNTGNQHHHNRAMTLDLT